MKALKFSSTFSPGDEKKRAHSLERNSAQNGSRDRRGKVSKVLYQWAYRRRAREMAKVVLAMASARSFAGIFTSACDLCLRRRCHDDPCPSAARTSHPLTR